MSRDLKLWNQEYPITMDCNLELSAKAIPPSLNLLLLWYFIKTTRQVTKAVLLYMANVGLDCGLSRNLNTSLKSWFCRLLQLQNHCHLLSLVAIECHIIHTS